MKNYFKRIFKASTENDSLGNAFRQKRMQLFNQCLESLEKPIRILDIGGNELFWTNAGYHKRKDVEITILNLQRIHTHHPNFTSVAGDATHLSAYADKSFDVAFSNSVIEHLYTLESQFKMAQEAMRVAQYHFIQSPNRYFPIEPHYLLPYFQFLPKKWRYFILTKTKLSRNQKWDSKQAQQYLDEIRLLSQKEYRTLFPNSRLWKEKFYGFNKSFVAHNF